MHPICECVCVCLCVRARARVRVQLTTMVFVDLGRRGEPRVFVQLERRQHATADTATCSPTMRCSMRRVPHTHAHTLLCVRPIWRPHGSQSVWPPSPVTPHHLPLLSLLRPLTTMAFAELQRVTIPSASAHARTNTNDEYQPQLNNPVPSHKLRMMDVSDGAASLHTKHSSHCVLLPPCTAHHKALLSRGWCRSQAWSDARGDARVEPQLSDLPRRPPPAHSRTRGIRVLGTGQQQQGRCEHRWQLARRQVSVRGRRRRSIHGRCLC